MDSVGCILVLVACVVAPFSYIVNGWVLAVLWRWFAVPLGLPSLTVPYAIGVALIVGFLTHQQSSPRGKDDRTQDEKVADGIAALLYSFVGPLFTLGIGWIVTQFI